MYFEEQLHEVISQRALELSYQHENNSVDCWLTAEQEIRQELDLRSDEIYSKFKKSDDNHNHPSLL